jgi:hypothetical protein
MSSGKCGSNVRYAVLRILYWEGIMLLAKAMGIGKIAMVPLRVPVMF